GKILAASSRSQIKLWDVTSGRPLRILEHTAYFEQFTFIEGGSRILSMHKDAEVRVWDPATARLLNSSRIGAIEPSSHIHSMSHDPSRNIVVLTAWNSPIVIWDYKARVSRGEFIFDASKNNSVNPEGAVLSGDGRTLIVGGGNLIKR